MTTQLEKDAIKLAQRFGEPVYICHSADDTRALLVRKSIAERCGDKLNLTTCKVGKLDVLMVIMP